MKLFLQPNAELANDYFELSVVNGFDINSIKDLLGKEFFEKNDTANKNYGVFAVDKDEDFNKLIEGYDVIFCGNSKLRKVGKIC